MNAKFITLLAIGAVAPALHAQQIRDGYVDWGPRGPEFCAQIATWQKGEKWSADDNFFISRVRPKTRFRNEATQVNPSLTEDVDKKLIFWVPINNEGFNALPDGVYDSEVFPMWSYITHYGNWSTSLCRIPGNFLDVAHKNGVPVSPVAGIPWGNISTTWNQALVNLALNKERVGDYLEYYGIDGLGYNSEFNGSAATVAGVRDLHEYLVRRFKTSGQNPLFENIWYDGTNDTGAIAFDQGLGQHNDDNWGYGDSERAALFFNYNWNRKNLLEGTVGHAFDVGRTPLDVYCGINMQGREPKGTGEKWPLMAKYPVSIGLWGAHSKNMFFEGRGEKGSHPDARQRSYMLRMERWFTGGLRNPSNCPPLSNSLKCNVDNEEFFGMSSLMSARSSLKWDIAAEPFITAFNLGNGKFLNWNGRRQCDNEWYNIGVQDYLPTWRWWWSADYMGRDAAKAETGMDAEFVWDDAWMGGSCVRIHGTSDRAYLHLFKTEFALGHGDAISITTKTLKGAGKLSLVVAAKGSEDTPVEIPLGALEADGIWHEATAVAGHDFDLPAELAMIALKFEGTSALDLRLGRLSVASTGINAAAAPATPVIETSEVLAYNRRGADAKVIFHMPNDKPAGVVCYNDEVGVGLFKVWSQQGQREPLLVGLTTSWAALAYSVPMDPAAPRNVRIGVSAVAPDMEAESPIAWGEWTDITELYTQSDDIAVDRTHIKPGDEFTVSYLDAFHTPADWKLTDANGLTVLEATAATALAAPEGLAAAGNYDLHINCGGDGRLLRGFVQVTSDDAGRIPEILTLTANGREQDVVEVEAGQSVDFEYTGREAGGDVSRGVRITPGGVGFKTKEAGVDDTHTFAVSFWFCPDEFTSSGTHLLNIRDKSDAWAKNTWGWFYQVLTEEGKFDTYTFSGKEFSCNMNFDESVRLHPGVWSHLAYVFEMKDKGGSVHPTFYLNGVKQPIASYTYKDKLLEKEPTFLPARYEWRPGNVLAIGGHLHNGGSVRGRIDDLMLWDVVLDDSNIASAMKAPADASAVEGLVACWDFEDEPQADGSFLSRGRKQIPAGMHDYADTETEGQGLLIWQQPVFEPGSPFSDGSTLSLASHPVVSVPGAVVESAEGNDLAGRVRVRFPDEATYRVRLAVGNELGESRPRYVTVRAGNASVESIEAEGGIRILGTPARDRIDLEISAPGHYDVDVWSLDGMRLYRTTLHCDRPGRVSLAPALPAGPAIIKVGPETRKALL